MAYADNPGKRTHRSGEPQEGCECGWCERKRYVAEMNERMEKYIQEKGLREAAALIKQAEQITRGKHDQKFY